MPASLKKESDNIEFSAIICTHNRAKSIINAVASLIDQSIAKGKYEIIIVDNASTDNTAELLKKEFSCISNLRYIFEPEIGLSKARNTGIEHSRGEYVAFLDDDATADYNWLKEVDNFLKNNKDVDCLGGKINMVWNTNAIPKWLTSNLYHYLCCLDLGKSCYLDKPNLGGANIFFKKDTLILLNCFSLKLGRKGNELYSGEETHVQLKILEKNRKIFYLHEAIVYHHIDTRRLSKKSFIKQAFSQGISSGILYKNFIDSRKMLTKFLARNLILSPIKNLLLLLLYFPCINRNFRYLVCLANFFGALKGFFINIKERN